MPTLREVQAAFAQGLRSRNAAPVLPFLLDDTAIAAADRLGIYRNTYVGTLIAALRITYPAVDRLVGEKFFDGAATQFVAAHVPEAANLNYYGGEFADFLAGFEPAAPLPYLPEVARLEWAVACAANAPDAAPLGPAALTGLADEDQVRVRFRPHPSTRLVQLAYDADRIRQAVIDRSEDKLSGFSPDPARFWLIAHRHGLDVVMRRLSEIEARTTEALLAGRPLGDVLTLLAEHLATGRFAGFDLAG